MRSSFPSRPRCLLSPPTAPGLNETLYPTLADDLQQYASVAMDANGGFIITWTDTGSSTQRDTDARKFDSLGGLLGVTATLDANGNTVYEPVYGQTLALV